MTTVHEREAEVYKVLEQCYDPEIPAVSLVDLGLIYDVSINEGTVDIKMTLTAQGCGMSGMIAEQVKSMVQDLPWVTSSSVQIVWDPPWHPDRMSDKAKKLLGFD